MFAVRLCFRPSSSVRMSFFLSLRRRRFLTPVRLVVVPLSFLVFLQFSPPSAAFVRPISPRIIDTQYGRLRGDLVTLSYPGLPKVEVYRGLQYASVLGGQLRFMPPTGPMEKWEGVRVAIKFRPVCPQRMVNLEEVERKMPPAELEKWRSLNPFLDKQQEDCLFLNIYVPAREKNESTRGHPVLLLVHSETYESGTGNAYDGSVLSAFGRIVVITLNYRLGVLGFFSTGESSAPGNYALLDLVAALQYIKENIHLFDGDPNEVTLLGHGHGAAIVNLLLVSPLTKGKGLFKRAILLSGSALSRWAIVTDPLHSALRLSTSLNCSLERLEDFAGVVSCLKNLPSDVLGAVEVSAPKYLSSLGPVIDRRTVLAAEVDFLMKKASMEAPVFEQTSLLVGLSTSQPCVSYLSRKDTEEGIPFARRATFIRTFVQNLFRFHRQKVFDTLDYHYTNWERRRDPQVIRDALMELLSDGLCVAPSVELSRYHATLPDSAPAYLYTFQSPFGMLSWATGGWARGSELAFLLGAPLVNGVSPYFASYSPQEKALSEFGLKYWTNFINFGNPNGPAEGGDGSAASATAAASALSSVGAGLSAASSYGTGLLWPQYDTETQKCLRMSVNPVVEHHFRGSKMALWIDLIPKIHRPENLSEAYHLLDSYDNLTSYDSDGLDLDTLRDLIRLYSPLYQRPNGGGSSIASPNARLVPSSIPPLIQPPRRVPTAASRTKTTARAPIKKPGLLSASETSGVAQTTPEIRGSSAAAVHRRAPLSLSVTVGVGCSLLSLNIIVFVAIFFQRRRNTGRLEKRRRDHFDKEMSFYLRPPPEVVEGRVEVAARVPRTPPLGTTSNGASTNDGALPLSASATPSHNSLQDISRRPSAAIGQTPMTHLLHHTTKPSPSTELTDQQQKTVINNYSSTISATDAELSPRRRRSTSSGLNSLPPHPGSLLHLGSCCEEDTTQTIRPILRTSLSDEKTSNNKRGAKGVEPETTRNFVHYALNSSTAV